MKLLAIRSKIMETKCDIICLQETKKENFDQNFIRKYCPPTFDRFEFVPSISNSGGTIII
jgi:exonuclease III